MIAVIRWFVESVRCQMSDAFFSLDLDVYVKRPCDKRQYILRETYCVARNCKYSTVPVQQCHAVLIRLSREKRHIHKKRRKRIAEREGVKHIITGVNHDV